MQVAIVGGTGGIGRALARVFASKGAKVIVVGQTFRDEGVEGIELLKADLSLMREARRVGKALPAESLDLVVFTTGIFAAPKREETPEGIERDMAVSYLSRLVILREIGPRLHDKARVFVMGYPGTGQTGTLDDLNAEKSYSAMRVHMSTVAGNEMLVLDSAKRYPQARFFGLNPGLIKTNIRDNLFGKDSLKSRVAEFLIGLFTPTAETYAKRIAPTLVSTEDGVMFDRKGRPIDPSTGLTPDYVEKYIAASEALAARGS